MNAYEITVITLAILVTPVMFWMLGKEFRKHKSNTPSSNF
uniref:Uncharacterized protein n=1 Tax=Candidatus Kentrum sp. FW TaxID=2126338 RepID=A0A450S9B9_9GAMM|nr:MAG: hypothetical protein BECKFW1821A_GA0114235_102031 [Candidatus Kentron sp. FW]VFJ70302.1 MAG: hypothetical protein BECKFW1821B_GA0114236_11833 [Candidatus Kentron sp. FW]